MFRNDVDDKKETKDAVALQNAIAVTKKVLELKKQQQVTKDSSEGEKFLEKIRNHQINWSIGHIVRVQKGQLPSKFKDKSPSMSLDETVDFDNIETRKRRGPVNETIALPSLSRKGPTL